MQELRPKVTRLAKERVAQVTKDSSFDNSRGFAWGGGSGAI